MNKYTPPENNSAGQSSIGMQMYVWDTEYTASATAEEEAKFVYLVPITNDPPEMGSAPDTIEITEADSPVKQYVSDRPDSPSLEFEYNFNTDGYNYDRVKSALSATQSKVYLMLLPLGSAFMIKATGNTWLAGGNPIHGAFNLTQSEEELFIPNLSTTFSDAGIATKTLEWLGSTYGVGTNTLADLIALDSMPAGRETDAVKAILNAEVEEEETELTPATNPVG